MREYTQDIIIIDGENKKRITYIHMVACESIQRKENPNRMIILWLLKVDKFSSLFPRSCSKLKSKRFICHSNLRSNIVVRGRFDLRSVDSRNGSVLCNKKTVYRITETGPDRCPHNWYRSSANRNYLHELVRSNLHISLPRDVIWIY